MATIQKSTLQFLKDLSKNNNKDWFNEHKGEYEAAKANFTEFIEALLPKLVSFDKEIAGIEAKKTVFRIYRDVRFSKDKTPFQTHLGAHIVGGGRKNEHGRAGYYIKLEPGKSMLAGGAHLPPANWMKAIREEIDHNAKDLKKIIKSPEFMRYFGVIQGEQLKTAPRDYPKDHPEIELLKYKSLLAVHDLKDSDVLSKDFLEHSAKVFKALYPFDEFLNRGL